ncbi:MAG: tetratricopeptide repeat protein [Lachnospiraceae bacterium]|nr:tetratricopeptide repeat protein [Lachnospiraceae bacterium]MBR6398858.1 tetratricopeptide repeat protein [Lachnospiraceae bacterium]
MINDYLEPEDYVEPRCVLCGDAYGAMPEVKSVPQQRIVAKMDEYMAHRDYAGAERHLLYWLEEAELGHDLRGQLLLRNELAGHYRKVQDKKNATLNAEKALELLKALDFEDTISAGTTYVNAATVMNAFGEDERSLELFGKARTVYENAPRTDKALLGGLYNNMALTYTSLGRYGEASELYEKALSVMQSVPGGKLEQAITYLNMADMYGKMKGEENAEKEIFACLDRAESLLAGNDGADDGYYAFVMEKCAPTFAHYGYFMTAETLRKKAEEIYARA